MSTPNHNGNLEERIIEVAKQLFIENGFEETSMSDIASRVGINRPTLHYYFRTKNKMFQAVLGQIIRPLVPKVHDVLCESKRPLKERIGELVDVYYRLFQETPALPLFVMREVKRDACHLMETAKLMRLDETAALIIDTLQIEMEYGNIARIPIHYVFFTFYAPFLAFKVFRPEAQMYYLMQIMFLCRSVFSRAFGRYFQQIGNTAPLKLRCSTWNIFKPR